VQDAAGHRPEAFCRKLGADRGLWRLRGAWDFIALL
jgi:hypothetical protein